MSDKLFHALGEELAAVQFIQDWGYIYKPSPDGVEGETKFAAHSIFEPNDFHLVTRIVSVVSVGWSSFQV